MRSSKRESPPSMAARKGESGFKMRLIWESMPGRSLTQWRERDDRTALKDSGLKGRA